MEKIKKKIDIEEARIPEVNRTYEAYLNMKKNIVFFLFSISLYSFSQEKKIELIYQECMYNSLSDKGIALKKYTKGFENHLITLKILKDSTGNSYRELLKSLSEGKRYRSEYEYSYLDSINTIEIEKIIPRNKECAKIISKQKNYTSYSKKFKSVIPDDKDNISQGLKNLYKILSIKDFELDFYKQKVFMILYTINDLDKE